MSTLTTPRLRIEPLCAEHAALVWPLQNDSKLYTYQPDDPRTVDELTRRYAFLAGAKSPDGTEDWLNWVVFSGDCEQPIGTFQATVPATGQTLIAYMVFSQFWRRGYAYEMAVAVLDHLFARYPEVPQIDAEIDTRNVPSIGLVERLGFTHVRTTKDADFFKGASSDEHTYRLTRTAWLEQGRAS